MSDLVARISRRARARRLSRTVKVLVGAGVLATIGGLLWVLLASPWLAVRTIEVDGVSGSLSEQVRAEVESELDRPLARVDLAGVSARVESLPQVRSAEVARRWPRTLSVEVVPREPAAFLVVETDGAEQFPVVDGEGVVIETGSERPQGLPRLAAPAGADGAPDPERVSDALAVLAAAPAEVVERATVVNARTPDDVRTRLSGDVLVHWGSAANLARKSQVLTALMGQDAKVYDVSAPDLPTTRG